MTRRLGRDELRVGAEGKSWIPMEDYAIAFADELETPRHARERFTAAYRDPSGTPEIFSVRPPRHRHRA